MAISRVLETFALGGMGAYGGAAVGGGYGGMPGAVAGAALGGVAGAAISNEAAYGGVMGLAKQSGQLGFKVGMRGLGGLSLLGRGATWAGKKTFGGLGSYAMNFMEGGTESKALKLAGTYATKKWQDAGVFSRIRGAALEGLDDHTRDAVNAAINRGSKTAHKAASAATRAGGAAAKAAATAQAGGASAIDAAVAAAQAGIGSIEAGVFGGIEQAAKLGVTLPGTVADTAAKVRGAAPKLGTNFVDDVAGAAAETLNRGPAYATKLGGMNAGGMGGVFNKASGKVKMGVNLPDSAEALSRVTNATTGAQKVGTSMAGAAVDEGAKAAGKAKARLIESKVTQKSLKGSIPSLKRSAMSLWGQAKHRGVGGMLGAGIALATGGPIAMGVGFALGTQTGQKFMNEAFGSQGSSLIGSVAKFAAKNPIAAGLGVGAISGGLKALTGGTKALLGGEVQQSSVLRNVNTAQYGMSPNNMDTQGLVLAMHYSRLAR